MDTPIWAPREGETCRRYFTGVEVRRNRTSGAEADNRTTVTINTGDEDRHGTIIEPGGAILDNYNQNPVVLINHNNNLLAGRSSVSLRNGNLVANMADADWDVDDPEIVRWFNKVKTGFLSAASIGFRPHEVTKELIDDEADPHDFENIRFRIKVWELLEWSWVSVPSNPNALVTERQLRSEDPTMLMLQSLDQHIAQLSNQLQAADEAADDSADVAEREKRSAEEAGSDAPEEAAQADASEDPPQRVIAVSLNDLRRLQQKATQERQKRATLLAKRRLGRA